MDIHWSHVGLSVTDLERSRRFYEEVFGFEHDTTIDVEGEDTATLMRLPLPCRVRVMMLVKSGFTLELMQNLDPGMKPFRERALNEPGLTHLNMRVEDVAEVRRRVVQFGGTVLEETILPELTGARAAFSHGTYIRDPDGQLIEVITDYRIEGGWIPDHLR